MTLTNTGEMYVLCFNRYMVECESSTGTVFHSVNSVLIDTWWNVNVERSETYAFQTQF